jgi:sulfatase maturation enzyme AslB (radical SAM superfamily)
MQLESILGAIVRKIIPAESELYRNIMLKYSYLQSAIKIKKFKALKITILLTDHCNLNCAYCHVLSPLAVEKFCDINNFKNDCERLSALTNRKVDSICLMGGEPLLHPQITDFFDIARSCFDKISALGGGGVINMTTNGILLVKQPESFWQNCHKNDIEVRITKYPISLDFEKIEAIAKKFGVNISYSSGTDKVTKRMHIIPLDIKGDNDIQDAWRLCSQAINCATLRDGRLYPCNIRSTISYFNSYFNTNLQESEADSIDIYKAERINDIFDFLRKPIPFCRYCDWTNAVFSTEWHKSKKEISEWTITA